MKLNKLLTLLIALAVLPTTAFSATFDLYIGAPLTDRADFLTDLGGAPTLTQDFQTGYLHGDDLDGVLFLPGIYVTTNMENVVAWVWLGEVELFGYPRGTPIDDYYDIHIDEAYMYKAVGFDIGSYDPETPGPGYIDVYIIDGVVVSVEVYPTNATETDPVFFGVISDTPVYQIRWTEGPETGGGNEETTLDNFVVSRLTTEIGVDIKPESCPNPIGTRNRGVLPVAIAGTEDFDATQIDPASLKLFLDPAEKVSPLRWALIDVITPYEPFIGKEVDAYACTVEGPDGYLDLTVKFKAQEVINALGDVSDRDVLMLSLTGNLKEEFGGTPIAGEDVILILEK